MNIKPLRNVVFIEKIEEENVTKSGIIVKTENPEKPCEGVVAFAGEDSAVPAGTRIVFKRYAPEEVELDGEKYLVCEDTDVLAVINMLNTELSE